MKKTANRQAETSGYLFALFGQACGVDCVPFLTQWESDPKVKKAMLTGRRQALKNKKKKKR